MDLPSSILSCETVSLKRLILKRSSNKKSIIISPSFSVLLKLYFYGFSRSAASVAANVVNNANSNNNNNNNNNNDNNDNVNNFNVANNNNAGNNFNDIQICPFPCIPGPPPVIVGEF